MNAAVPAPLVMLDPRRERRLLWASQSLLAAAQAGAAVALSVAALAAGQIWLVGVLVALAAGPSVFARLVGAHVSRTGHRRALITGPAVVALACVPAALHPGAAVLAVAALGAGVGRAWFDVASHDLLHHHLPADRLPGAALDLTRRFLNGQIAGLSAGAVVAVLVAPSLAIALAGLAALAASAAASAFHPALDAVPGQRRDPLGAMLREGERLVETRPVLRRITRIERAGWALSGAAAALVFPTLRAHLGDGVLVAFLAGIALVLAGRGPLVRLTQGAPLLGMQATGLLVMAVALGGIAMTGAAVPLAVAYGATILGTALMAAGGRRARTRSTPDAALLPALHLGAGARAAAAACLGALAGAAGASLAPTPLVLAALSLVGLGCAGVAALTARAAGARARAAAA